MTRLPRKWPRSSRMVLSSDGGSQTCDSLSSRARASHSSYGWQLHVGARHVDVHLGLAERVLHAAAALGLDHEEDDQRDERIADEAGVAQHRDLRFAAIEGGALFELAPGLRRARPSVV